jgi:chromosomal replication initiator protein
MAEFAAELAGDSQGVIAKIRSSLESAAILGLDGIEILGNLPLAQETCYSLINQCLDEGRQVVATSQVVPKQIASLESRLLTRLMAGLLIAIDAPLVETRSAYLRSLIGARFDQQDPIRLQEILKTRVFTMRQVEDLARRLDAGERLAAPLAALDAIVRVVAAHYQIRPQDLTSASRERACSLARQTALLLARRLTNYSLVGLGSMTGGRDHSTVIYAIRTAEKRAENDPTYAALVETLSQKALQ